MKLNIICFYDSLLNAFCNPAYTDREPDVEAKSLDRFIRSGGKGYEQYLNKVLYHFGTFDDESGELIVFKDKVRLLDTREELYESVSKKSESK